MTATEQLDFSYMTVSLEEGVAAGCDDFMESVWNLDTTCQSINASTCVAFWDNEGPAANIFGVGWGWNDTVWVNHTAEGAEKPARAGQSWADNEKYE